MFQLGTDIGIVIISIIWLVFILKISTKLIKKVFKKDTNHVNEIAETKEEC